MSIKPIGTLFLLLFMSLLVVSCNKDEELVVPSEPDVATNAELRPGGGGGNPNPTTDNANVMPPTLAGEWTDLLLETERYAAGLRPNGSARALAYIYLAAYETALPAMRGYVSNTSRLQGLSIDRNDRGNRDLEIELALNACFADVVDHSLVTRPVTPASLPLLVAFSAKPSAIGQILPTGHTPAGKSSGEHRAPSPASKNWPRRMLSRASRWGYTYGWIVPRDYGLGTKFLML